MIPALDRIRQLVRGPLGTIQVGVGLVVAGEKFLFGVPAERPPEPPGDAAEMTDGRRAVADLDVGNTPIARLDAVDEVLQVVVAPVKAEVGVGKRLLGDAGGHCAELASRHDELALLADELSAAEDPVVGLQALCEVCRTVERPVVAIGGITPENMVETLEAGASYVAVVSALPRFFAKA